MATVLHGVSTASTSNATVYTSGSFTPVLNDLIVVFVVASGTTAAAPTLIDSVSGTYTLVATAQKGGGGDRLYAFVGNQLASAIARTLTFECAADAATGAIIQAARISGMTLTGSAAVRQSQVQSNQASGGTPAPAFPAAALTGNPTLGLVGNATNPATLTPPTNWTERNDTGFATPATGAEYVSRDSGFTGTTITWGGTSATAFGSMILELDTSAAPSGQPIVRRWGAVPYVGGRKAFNGAGGGAWG